MHGVFRPSREIFDLLLEFHVRPRRRELVRSIETRPVAFFALWTTLLAVYAIFFNYILSSTTFAARSVSVLVLYGLFTLLVAAVTWGRLAPGGRQRLFYATLPIGPTRLLALRAGLLLLETSWLPILFFALSAPYVLRTYALNLLVLPLHLLVCLLIFVRVALLVSAVGASRRVRRAAAVAAVLSLASYVVASLFANLMLLVVVVVVEAGECWYFGSRHPRLGLRVPRFSGFGLREHAPSSADAMSRVLLRAPAALPAPRLVRRTIERLRSPVVKELVVTHVARRESVPALVFAALAFFAFLYAAVALPEASFRSAHARPLTLAAVFSLFVFGLALTITSSFARKSWLFFRVLPLSFARLTLLTARSFWGFFSIPAGFLLLVGLVAAPRFAPLALFGFGAIPLIAWLGFFLFRANRLFAVAASAILVGAYLWSAYLISYLVVPAAVLLIVLMLRSCEREYRRSAP